MENNIEVEVRGPLPTEQYQKFLSFFTTNATKIGEKNRVLIDYSSVMNGDLSQRTKDIRLRVTNGVPEIIVKLGAWNGTDHRRELSVKTELKSFDTLVEIFGHLGYTSGVLCARQSIIFKYKDIEFALVTVPGHSAFFEAEKMAHADADLTEITQEIVDVCREIGLSIFEQQEFFAYVNTLNREANEQFDFAKYTIGSFRKRFGLE